MKTNFLLLAVILGGILAISSCTDLKKDLPTPSSGLLKTHDDGWNDTISVNFHGKYLKTKNWQTSECKSCHGNSFDGGTSGLSCFGCHESFPHDVKFSTSAGHAEYMKSNEYPLTNCQTCHGATYNGGNIGVSCLSSGCHINPNGPEACNTCHGNFSASASNAFSWAPPRSVLGDILETSPGVGAHQAHLAEGEFSNLITCNQCHKVPASVLVPGHIDSPLPAEVIFNTSLAALPSANHTFNPNPEYNHNSLRCSNTFCHGDWYLQRPKLPADTSRNFMYIDTVMSGSNYSPRWISGQEEIQCGTCHGLPPVGHKDFQTQISACYTCHYQSETMNKSKHINGKVNIFGKERDF